jgi:hypothetical protein
MKAKIVFFLLCSSMILMGWLAQAGIEQRKDSLALNLQLALSAGLHRLQDDGMSLSRYSGWVPGISMALQKEKKNRISTASWMGQRANLTPVGREGRMANLTTQHTFQFDYHLFFLVNQWAKKNYRWAFGANTGAFIRARVSPKLGNSARTYDGVAFLGPAMMRQSSFQWNSRQILWRSRLSVPLVAGIVRPSLTNLRDFFDPTIPDLQSRWEQHGITRAGSNFFMLRMGTELYYPLAKGHQVHLQYAWEYFQYNKVNPVNSAMHSIILGYEFSLSK